MELEYVFSYASRRQHQCSYAVDRNLLLTDCGTFLFSKEENVITGTHCPL